MTLFIAQTTIDTLELWELNGRTTQGWYFYDENIPRATFFGPYKTQKEAAFDETLYRDAIGRSNEPPASPPNPPPGPLASGSN